jgi:hypothetical protein
MEGLRESGIEVGNESLRGCGRKRSTPGKDRYEKLCEGASLRLWEFWILG